MPIFTRDNTNSAFECRFHFCWPTHRRQPLFADQRAQNVIRRSFADVVARCDYHCLENTLEPCVLRALLSLKPLHAPSDVTRIVKGNLAASARKELDLRQLWSRGSFVRSVGHATNEVVRNYIAGQYGHHNAAPVEDHDRAVRAKFHRSADTAELRRNDHAVFEYNLHVVFGTWHRSEFLDLDVATALVTHWRDACEQSRWIAWDIEVVWSHAHLFLGLSLTDAPDSVALRLMNSAEEFMEGHFRGLLTDTNARTNWRPSYCAGTVGSATTAQVKAFLDENDVG